MIDGIEEFYQIIANAIQEAIPEPWSSAKMEAIFFSECSQFEGEYVRQADNLERSFASDGFEAEEAFMDIRGLFAEVGKPLWGRACFQLSSDGNFNMTWDYDNCDDDGFAIFDEDTELERAQERQRRLSQI